MRTVKPKPQGKAPPRGSKSAKKESRAVLSSILSEAGIEITPEKLDKLWRFHQLVRKNNEKYDLTRLTTFEDFAVKHYIDCLILPQLIKLPSPLLDMGTGAGFPGIPLKIASPETEIILSESRAKRVEFLNLAIGELRLKGIETMGGIVKGKREKVVQAVITRAFESAEDTLDRVENMLPVGGRVILMKGPGAEIEIKNASERFRGIYALEKDLSYDLGNTKNRRRLIIFRKIKDIQVMEEKRLHETLISSTSNRLFKMWKTLLSGKGIKKEGLAIVSGQKVILELLETKKDIIRTVLLPPKTEPLDRNLFDHPVYRLSGELFRELDVNGTGQMLLVVETPAMTQFVPELVESPAILIIPFQDPSNVGAVIRSAAAFGIRDIVLLRESANPFHPKSLRAAGTQAFMINYMEGPSITELKNIGLPILALSTSGTDIMDFDFPLKFALLPGIEGPGLPETLKADHEISIPMEQGVESLNAAVATGIILYEWVRRTKGYKR